MVCNSHYVAVLTEVPQVPSGTDAAEKTSHMRSAYLAPSPGAQPAEKEASVAVGGPSNSQGELYASHMAVLLLLLLLTVPVAIAVIEAAPVRLVQSSTSDWEAGAKTQGCPAAISHFHKQPLLEACARGVAQATHRRTSSKIVVVVEEDMVVVVWVGCCLHLRGGVGLDFVLCVL